MRAKMLLILPSTIAVCIAAACGQRAPESSSFVATLGPNDTVAVEHFTRSGDTLTGTSVTAYPRATVRSYEVTFDSAGAVEHIHFANGEPGEDPTTTADLTYTGDSVAVEVHRDSLMRRYAVATDGTRPLPFYEDLFVFWDLDLGHQMAGSADSTTFETTAGQRLLPITFQRKSATEADFGFPEWGTAQAYFDQAGQLDSMELTRTTSKYTVRRVPSVDVQATATAWAARPQQPGALSPRDTASAQVGTAHVTIDYGRPGMRGRKVFGGIVPFGEVWRLGANAATQLITDQDLTIGDTEVPAGTYSLWAVPQADGWTLIVNSQHGQWGTQYDASQDFARIPMTVSQLDEPVERFTISVEPDGSDGGTISMEWETTRATVPFKVR